MSAHLTITGGSDYAITCFHTSNVSVMSAHAHVVTVADAIAARILASARAA